MKFNCSLNYFWPLSRKRDQTGGTFWLGVGRLLDWVVELLKRHNLERVGQEKVEVREGVFFLTF